MSRQLSLKRIFCYQMIVLISSFVGVCSFAEMRNSTRPLYEKKQAMIGSHKIEIEIAKTMAEHEYGLMFVKKLSENQGMLFVFDKEQIRTFWMKNTLIPLSIAYLNSKKIIVDIQEMVPASPMDLNPLVYPSTKPAQFALEMNKSWFANHKIKVGDVLRILN